MSAAEFPRVPYESGYCALGSDKAMVLGLLIVSIALTIIGALGRADTIMMPLWAKTVCLYMGLPCMMMGLFALFMMKLAYNDTYPKGNMCNFMMRNWGDFLGENATPMHQVANSGSEGCCGPSCLLEGCCKALVVIFTP